MTIEYEIDGFGFCALNGGDDFQPNPSISFFVRCKDAAEVDRLWAALQPGGTALMPLDSYPFNERYGWIQDRFGVSWQIVPNSRMNRVLTGPDEDAKRHLFERLFDMSKITMSDLLP